MTDQEKIEKLADEFLRKSWEEHSNDASPEALGKTVAVIQAFLAVTVLDSEKAELWRLRIISGCSYSKAGHDGGRAWCAYCGNLPSEDRTGSTMSGG
jgi:hypothetical protein